VAPARWLHRSGLTAPPLLARHPSTRICRAALTSGALGRRWWFVIAEVDPHAD
jgi:hypothetical protein